MPFHIGCHGTRPKCGLRGQNKAYGPFRGLESLRGQSRATCLSEPNPQLLFDLFEIYAP